MTDPQSSQQSLFQFERVTRFNFSVWTVLTGTLLARTSYFMAWPFLIVFLYNDYGVSALEVGIMLSSSALVGSLTGLYSGYLSDKFGRKKIMVCGSLLASLTYAGIGVATQVWQFYILVLITGLMRPMIEGPAKAVLGDNLADKKDRELALNIRYFLLNLGGAIGPLIGITLALHKPQALFIATGVTYLVYSLWLYIGLERTQYKRTVSAEALPNFARTLGIIAKDSVFIRLMIANFLMMFVYAQIESSIPQVIVRSGIEQATKIIAGLVLVNTITIIVFQFPTLKLLEKQPLFFRARLGMALMAVAQLGFLFTPEHWPAGWLIACFVLSIGEVIAFPTLNVQIDKLAPEHLRGSYFGAATLCALGFAVAPLVGGLMIGSLNSNWLFAGCFVVCLIMIWLYFKAENKAKDLHLQTAEQSL
ncbi:MDR family MFS transporter [Vibrio ulleungensis]|uniref:MFS transporter n=1 Tax=Vibrio ulleungensis TaxID=2807619 RepID=A0ABS2HPM0_9VIBR|nr:MFS transporter [Vibrio ulleungensis]MBM7038153.1 MFS transporter [Vibrio ulleungensis]